MNPTQPVANAVIDLTQSNFPSQILNDQSPILIDFWAPWCGPCRIMKPLFHEAATLLKGEVRAAAVNVDEEPHLAQAFGIQGIPTLVLVSDGRVVDAWSGVQPAAALADRVRARLAK